MTFDSNHGKRKQLTRDWVAKEAIKDPADIIRRAPDIWQLWADHTLLPEGMSYIQFYEHLQQLYLENQMISAFGGFFNG